MAEAMGPLRRGVRETGLALVTLGVIVLLFVAYQLFGTNLAANASQSQLKQSFDHQVAAAGSGGGAGAPGASAPTTTLPPGAQAPGSTSPTAADTATVGGEDGAPATPGGGAIDHLVIPAIGLDKYVVDGTGESDLSKGPGHYLGTPYPGQVGDVAIAGHRTTYGAPFFRIGELKIGDAILLTDTTGRTFRYVVDQPNQVVAPTDVAVIGATPTATLTLTTCNPPLSATSRLIVKASLAGSTAPAPAPVAPTAATATPPTTAAHPVVVSAPHRYVLNGGTPSAWPEVVGWGAAVVALWVLTRLAINRTRRWRRAGAYVVGIGVCCVPLWPCFESAARLLPQSI